MYVICLGFNTELLCPCDYKEEVGSIEESNILEEQHLKQTGHKAFSYRQK